MHLLNPVSFKRFINKPVLILSALAAGISIQAHALDLDWSGQFRAESHHVFNYSLSGDNTTNDVTRSHAEGYYIPGGGRSSASFQTLFLRLRPVVIVNDNIYIKSEWWIGDAIYGMFGSGAPYALDQQQFYSTGSRGSLISAQRLWGEFLTDVGTFQLGRMPMHWGLGMVWNEGAGPYDRYMSTGDALRLVSKFGLFSLSPGIYIFSKGSNIGGACSDPTSRDDTGACKVTSKGDSGFTDYSIALKYDNTQEKMELGINYVRRIAGSLQDGNVGLRGPNGTTGMNYNVFDIYGSRQWGRFKLAGELPFSSGKIGSSNYSSWALALEATLKATETWEFGVKGGIAPGQGNQTSADAPGTFSAFFFHPAYRTGLIMFNYQLRNFSGPNTLNNPSTGEANLRSPYDNPIANAKYLHLYASHALNKWDIRGSWTYAVADKTAASTYFYNSWRREMVATGSGVADQKSGLGWELDFGTTYHWDEAFRFDADFGIFVPGGFYEFSNTSTANTVGTVFAGVFRIGVQF